MSAERRAAGSSACGRRRLGTHRPRADRAGGGIAGGAGDAAAHAGAAAAHAAFEDLSPGSRERKGRRSVVWHSRGEDDSVTTSRCHDHGTAGRDAQCRRGRLGHRAARGSDGRARVASRGRRCRPHRAPPERTSPAAAPSSARTDLSDITRSGVFRHRSRRRAASENRGRRGQGAAAAGENAWPSLRDRVSYPAGAHSVGAPHRTHRLKDGLSRRDLAAAEAAAWSRATGHERAPGEIRSSSLEERASPGGPATR